MIIETNYDAVSVTLNFARPSNPFQDEVLAETLIKLTEILNLYQEHYNEYE